MGNPQKEFDRLGPWATRFWVDGLPCGGSSYDPTNDGRIALFETKVGHLRGKRILELGALEGGHTLQLARKGATVVAVEGRPANYRRCLFVKEFFQLEEVEFILADLRSLDFDPLGRFDVIFNVGVLYHLNEPWRLLQSLRNVAARMFIWTHCAPGDKIDAAVEVNGCRLEGLRWQEGSLEVPLSGLQPTSFWPTRESLEKMLALSGWPNLTWLDYNPQSPNGPSATLWVEQPSPVSEEEGMFRSGQPEANSGLSKGPASPGPRPLPSDFEQPPNPNYRPTVARLSCFNGLPEAAIRALEAMSRDESFAGNADPSILNLLDALISGNDMTRVLQLGTMIGFSAVILAGALQRVQRATGASVRLDTVDCDASKHARARAYLAMAGFDSFVRFLDGYSTDPNVLDQLGDERYDLIFVDSSHNYSQTKKEIAAYWPRLKPGGSMVFHDAGQEAAAYDPAQEGGVRRALDEWLENPPDDVQSHLLLEPPYWANPCGAFWAIKRA